MENAVQSARFIGNSNAKHLGDGIDEILALENLRCCGEIINNDTHDAEVRGFGEGQRTHVDVVFCQYIRQQLHLARLVFNENRNLIECHDGILLLRSCACR